MKGLAVLYGLNNEQLNVMRDAGSRLDTEIDVALLSVIPLPLPRPSISPPRPSPSPAYRYCVGGTTDRQFM